MDNSYSQTGHFMFMVQNPLASTKIPLKSPWKLDTLLKPQWSNSECSMGFVKDPIREKKHLVFAVAMRPWYILVLPVLWPLPTIIKMVMRSSTIKRIYHVHPKHYHGLAWRFHVMDVRGSHVTHYWEIQTKVSNPKEAAHHNTHHSPPHLFLRDQCGTLPFIGIPSCFLLLLSASQTRTL